MLLQEVLAKMAEAKKAWDEAKSKKAMRYAREDYEFWSNKAAMLDVMEKRL